MSKELTQTDVFEVGQRLRRDLLECVDVDNVERCAIFLEEDGIVRCKATPAKMQELLDELKEVTDAISEDTTGVEYVADIVTDPLQVAGRLSVGFDAVLAARNLLEAAGEAINPKKLEVQAKILATEQWNRDLLAWEERFNRYQAYLDQVQLDHPDDWDNPEGCRLIQRTVIDPLLFGWFWEPMPGIMQTTTGLEDVQTRPDWVEPFTLGNQRLAYKDAMYEALVGLANDLTTLDPGAVYCEQFSGDPRCWNWRAIGIGAGVVGAALVGLWAWSKFRDLSDDEIVVRVEAPRPLPPQRPTTPKRPRSSR